MSTGKTANRKTITIFAHVPKPNHRTSTGTSATIGVAYSAIVGRSSSASTMRERPTARPSTMPTTVPAARPTPSTSRLLPIASSRMPSAVML